MKINNKIDEFLNRSFLKKIFPGFLIFLCIVLSPFFEPLLLLLKIPNSFVFFIITIVRFLFPFVIIGLFFRKIPAKQGILIIILAAGICRIITEILISPVPLRLISTLDYWAQIIVYVAVLSIVGVGVMFYDEKKRLALGLIVSGLIVYCLWILFNLN
jgi:hypothetical protein